MGERGGEGEGEDVCSWTDTRVGAVWVADETVWEIGVCEAHNDRIKERGGRRGERKEERDSRGVKKDLPDFAGKDKSE